VTIYNGGTLVLNHNANDPVGNVGLKNFVRPQNNDQAVYYTYWTPIVDNPDSSPAGSSGEWAMYTGASSIYWETLDPRFQLSP
jgi:hypothetical protein